MEAIAATAVLLRQMMESYKDAHESRKLILDSLDLFHAIQIKLAHLLCTHSRHARWHPPLTAGPGRAELLGKTGFIEHAQRYVENVKSSVEAVARSLERFGGQHRVVKFVRAIGASADFEKHAAHVAASVNNLKTLIDAAADEQYLDCFSFLSFDTAAASFWNACFGDRKEISFETFVRAAAAASCCERRVAPCTAEYTALGALIGAQMCG